MWELIYKESWALKSCCIWTVDFWESFGLQGIQPVHPKGNWFLLFIERTDTEAETPILWPPDAKNWLIWKDLHAVKDWRQKEKGPAEDGWMVSPTQWTWVRVNLRSWWWTGRPGVLQSMGSQRIGHDWATELNATYIQYRWYLLESIDSLLVLNKTRKANMLIMYSLFVLLPIIFPHILPFVFHLSFIIALGILKYIE